MLHQKMIDNLSNPRGRGKRHPTNLTKLTMLCKLRGFSTSRRRSSESCAHPRVPKKKKREAVVHSLPPTTYLCGLPVHDVALRLGAAFPNNSTDTAPQPVTYQRKKQQEQLRWRKPI